MNQSAEIKKALVRNDSQFILGELVKSLDKYESASDTVEKASGRQKPKEFEKYYRDLKKLIVNSHKHGGNPIFEQMKLTDHVAEMWIEQVSRLNLNIFQGFKDEQSLLNYALNVNGSRDHDPSKIVAGWSSKVLLMNPGVKLIK